MKLSNIFKKSQAKVKKNNTKVLDKNQLSKVTGGTETVGTVPLAGGAIAGASERKSGYVVASDY